MWGVGGVRRMSLTLLHRLCRSILLQADNPGGCECVCVCMMERYGGDSARSDMSAAAQACDC